jgi:arylsulfatase A-like enzyme
VEHAWTLYEESIRVPLVVWAPGILAPERVSTPVSTVDLLPTLLELASVDFAQRDFDGAPLFRAKGEGYAPSPAPRPVVSELLVEERCMLRAVVDGEHKYVAAMKWLTPAERSEAVTLLQARRDAYLEDPSLRTGNWAPTVREELYDLSADPGERTDLAAEHPQELARLRSVLEAPRRKAEALASEPGADEASTPMDAETRERLRALGYIGAEE